MKNRNLVSLTMLLVMFGIMALASGTALADSDGNRSSGRTFIVDDNLQCPGSTFTSIQAAVAVAPPGSTINVCPGVYNEQVKVTKNLTIRGVPFMNQAASVVKPNLVLPNSTDGIAAIILAENASNVDIESLTVDGATNGIAACAPTLAGVYFHNASGEVEQMAVRNIRLGATLAGCQSGHGILVQSDAGKRSNVEIEDNSVHDYQKNGITANDAGTNVSITGNAVSGIGPTADIAQNGIQVGYGAKGIVAGNSVINHIYSLCTTASCNFISTNIIVFNSNGVVIGGNNTGKSQVNIYVQGNQNQVGANTIQDSDVFDGIDLVGDNNRASFNKIFNSDDAGVFVQGTHNTVQGNFINEALEGVLEFAPSSANDLNNNFFVNVETKVVPAGSSSTTSTTAAVNGLVGGASVKTVSPSHP